MMDVSVQVGETIATITAPSHDLLPPDYLDLALRLCTDKAVLAEGTRIMVLAEAAAQYDPA